MDLSSTEKVYIIVIISALGMFLGAFALILRPDWRRKLEGSPFIPALLGLIGLLLSFIGLKLKRAKDTPSKGSQEPQEHPEPKNTTHTPHHGADHGDNITEIEAEADTQASVNAHDDDLGSWLDNHFDSTGKQDHPSAPTPEDKKR